MAVSHASSSFESSCVCHELKGGIFGNHSDASNRSKFMNVIFLRELNIKLDSNLFKICQNNLILDQVGIKNNFHPVRGIHKGSDVSRCKCFQTRRKHPFESTFQRFPAGGNLKDFLPKEI